MCVSNPLPSQYTSTDDVFADHLQRSIREESSRIQNRFKSRNSPSKSSDSPSTTTEDAIEGIWELHGERPPPSSIAARKDTSEARKLAHVLDTHYSKIHALHLWKEVSPTPLSPR
jgi:hypothetical protein